MAVLSFSLPVARAWHRSCPCCATAPRSGRSVPATLVFSARSREELLFFDELSELAASGDGFSLMVALTREAAAHPFRAGRIDAAFIAGIVSAMKMPVRQVLICGSDRVRGDGGGRERSRPE